MHASSSRWRNLELFCKFCSNHTRNRYNHGQLCWRCGPFPKLGERKRHCEPSSEHSSILELAPACYSDIIGTKSSVFVRCVGRPGRREYTRGGDNHRGGCLAFPQPEETVLYNRREGPIVREASVCSGLEDNFG